MAGTIGELPAPPPPPEGFVKGPRPPEVTGSGDQSGAAAEKKRGWVQRVLRQKQKTPDKPETLKDESAEAGLGAVAELPTDGHPEAWGPEPVIGGRIDAPAQGVRSPEDQESIADQGRAAGEHADSERAAGNGSSSLPSRVAEASTGTSVLSPDNLRKANIDFAVNDVLAGGDLQQLTEGMTDEDYTAVFERVKAADEARRAPLDAGAVRDPLSHFAVNEGSGGVDAVRESGAREVVVPPGESIQAPSLEPTSTEAPDGYSVGGANSRVFRRADRPATASGEAPQPARAEEPVPVAEVTPVNATERSQIGAQAGSSVDAASQPFAEPASVPEGFKVGQAVFAAHDGDIPVNVTGYAGRGPDGRDYAYTDSGSGAIPLDEVRYPQPEAEVEQPAPAPEPVAAGSQSVESAQAEAPAPAGGSRLEAGGAPPPPRPPEQPPAPPAPEPREPGNVPPVVPPAREPATPPTTPLESATPVASPRATEAPSTPTKRPDASPSQDFEALRSEILASGGVDQALLDDLADMNKDDFDEYLGDLGDEIKNVRGYKNDPRVAHEKRMVAAEYLKELGRRKKASDRIYEKTFNKKPPGEAGGQGRATTNETVRAAVNQMAAEVARINAMDPKGLRTEVDSINGQIKFLTAQREQYPPGSDEWKAFDSNISTLGAVRAHASELLGAKAGVRTEEDLREEEEAFQREVQAFRSRSIEDLTADRQGLLDNIRILNGREGRLTDTVQKRATREQIAAQRERLVELDRILQLKGEEKTEQKWLATATPAQIEGKLRAMKGKFAEDGSLTTAGELQELQEKLESASDANKPQLQQKLFELQAKIEKYEEAKKRADEAKKAKDAEGIKGLEAKRSVDNVHKYSDAEYDAMTPEARAEHLVRLAEFLPANDAAAAKTLRERIENGEDVSQKDLAQAMKDCAEGLFAGNSRNSRDMIKFLGKVGAQHPEFQHGITTWLERSKYAAELNKQYPGMMDRLKKFAGKRGWWMILLAIAAAILVPGVSAVVSSVAVPAVKHQL